MSRAWRVAVAILAAATLAGGCSVLRAEPPAPEPPAARWSPEVGTTWHIQFTGPLDATSAAVVDLDVDVPADAVARYKSQGKRTLCYINVGAWENWRDDAAEFPSDVLGRPLPDWPGERWLDIRRHDVLLPLMAARIDTCRAKGFDAVDPDNVDGHTHRTGFPLTQADSVAWVLAIAKLAREQGLAAGLKNGPDLVPHVLDSTDFAVVEECVQYSECSAWAPYLNQDKAVFHVEYTGTRAEVCMRRPAAFSTVITDRMLGPGGESC